ncbi:MAG: endonuclease/exonuclease/phosphatase family protein [Proteobacteria bacterium]|nr:endonuclease/exonuclease/phosphatase family protein [Pseudomonadota bacterium]
MPQPLRIATFNLESLDDRPDVAPPLAARIAVLRPQLLRLKADVLCLQEVNGQRPPGGGPRQLLALERLLAETPYAGFHLISSSRVSGPDSEAERGADAVHNLVILSRHPFGSTEELRHHLVEPPTYRPKTARPAVEREQAIEWDRPILAAAIELAAGRRLHVVNLHLRAPLAAPVPGQKKDAHTWRSVSGWAEGFFLATVKRAGQALETRLFIERIFDHDARALVAVCGDFNAEERQTPLRTIRADSADTGNAALAGRALVPLERTLPASQRFSVVHGGHKEMLDHVLVSRALLDCYRHVEVHNEGLADELSDAGPASHHAPLVAEFAL